MLHCIVPPTLQTIEQSKVNSLDSHCKSVDILVQLVHQGNALDDHVVHTIHIKLDLATRV